MSLTTRFAVALFASAIAMPMSALLAGDKHGKQCPLCGCEICQPTATVLKQKKHCWKVECKTICVPKARWPWERSCDPGTAEVRTIRVLSRFDYECEKCGWKWELQEIGAPCAEPSPLPTAPIIKSVPSGVPTVAPSSNGRTPSNIKSQP